LPLKDLVRGPVCWAKMVHFWKPRKHAFWPSPECREPFSMLPRHALSSFMVWNAGVGPWWAATAEIFKGYGFKSHCLPTPAEHAKLLFTRQTSNVYKDAFGTWHRETRNFVEVIYIGGLTSYWQANSRKPFSMLPRHAGVGPWWAATAEIFKGYGFKFHCLPTPAKHAPQTMHPVLLA